MTEDGLPDLPLRAFAKADPSPDTLFYAVPRFVTHIDDGAIAAVTGLYRALFPANGTVLDLIADSDDSSRVFRPKPATYSS